MFRTIILIWFVILGCVLDTADAAVAPQDKPTILSVRVQEDVVPSEPFLVNITAYDPTGLQSAQIQFAGILVESPMRGAGTAIATMELQVERPGLFSLTATVINAEGVRSDPRSIFVSAGNHSSDAPAEDVLEDLARVTDPYALYEPGPLYEPGLSTERKTALAEKQRDKDERLDRKGKLTVVNWWEKYVSRRARQPFDWNKYCGPTTSITPNGEVLECWLFWNFQVPSRMIWGEVDLQTGAVDENEYANWDLSMVNDLHQAFYDYYTWLENGLGPFPGNKLSDPPVNQYPLQDGDSPITQYSKKDARDLYVHSVAHSLALEIGGFVPWSVLNYSQSDLDRLFSLKYLLNAGKHKSGTIEFNGYWPFGNQITPAPPTTTFAFLVEQNLIRATHFDTIARYLKWGRDHLLHGSGAWTTEEAEGLWEYRGNGPVSRILEGTPHESDPNDIAHYTGGCHGATFFTKLLLRGVNIPVSSTWVPNFGDIGGHRSPAFLTIGRVMSHGDDISTARVNAPSIDPSYIPPDWILIPEDHFSAWFNQGNPLRWDNVGRQIDEIAIAILPNRLLDMHCDDLAANLTPANSSVYSVFKDWYTPSELETQRHLWERLNEKVTTLDYCAAYSLPVAPTLQSPANGATGVSSNPTLNWGDVVGATSYQIQVATDPGFVNLFTSKNEPVSKWMVEPSLNSNTKYYWRVRAHNPCCGHGPYSTGFSFTTQ